jgi:hypothetical protein
MKFLYVGDILPGPKGSTMLFSSSISIISGLTTGPTARWALLPLFMIAGRKIS